MKKANEKISAASVIIGNEILSGRTQDVNVSFLSKWLNALGVSVGEVRIIEDREESIINCIHEIKKNLSTFLLQAALAQLMMILLLSLLRKLLIYLLVTTRKHMIFWKNIINQVNLMRAEKKWQ